MSKQQAKKSDRGLNTKDVNDLVNALKAVKINNTAIRAAATAFNIPRTSLTRYVRTFEATGKNIIDMNDEQLKVFVTSLATYGTHTLV